MRRTRRARGRRSRPGSPPTCTASAGIEARSVSGIAGTVPASGSPLAGAIAAATDLVRLTRPTLTTGLQRRSKTFWEVAADYGLQTAVVNWWATWPAPSGAGIVLSDRATLRLERGDQQDAEIAPPSLYSDLEPVWPTLRDEARRRVVAAFEGTGDADGQVLRRAAEQDALPAALATRVFADGTGPSGDLPVGAGHRAAQPGRERRRRRLARVGARRARRGAGAVLRVPGRPPRTARRRSDGRVTSSRW